MAVAVPFFLICRIKIIPTVPLGGQNPHCASVNHSLATGRRQLKRFVSMIFSVADSWETYPLVSKLDLSLILKMVLITASLHYPSTSSFFPDVDNEIVDL